MRALLLAGALFGLMFSQPVASSVQTPATTAAPAAGTAQNTTGGGPMDEQLFKYALTQGGLTIVCLVLFWWIQREHKRQDAAKDERMQILVDLVEKNTAALVAAESTNARLSRAIETTRFLPPGVTV